MGDWHESYLGGSVEAERTMIEQFAQDMRDIQSMIVQKTGKHGNRTLHAKIIAGFQNARLHIDQVFPADFFAGYFQPEQHFPVSVRFSNASPVCNDDTKSDMRGIALRIHYGEHGYYHDLLMTSFPVSHARDAMQFVDIAKIATGPKEELISRLTAKYGAAETERILTNIQSGSKPSESLASLQFWSRAAILWGNGGPVRYTLRPAAHPHGAKLDDSDPNYLQTELAARLNLGEVTYRLALQRYVDSEKTPIEDGTIEWLESDSPFVDVATLVIPQQDLFDDEGAAMKAAVNKMAFNPWNCPKPFRPLGSLNRARGRVYANSAEGWLGSPPPKPEYLSKKDTRS